MIKTQDLSAQIDHVFQHLAHGNYAQFDCCLNKLYSEIHYSDIKSKQDSEDVWSVYLLELYQLLRNEDQAYSEFILLRLFKISGDLYDGSMKYYQLTIILYLYTMVRGKNEKPLRHGFNLKHFFRKAGWFERFLLEEVLFLATFKEKGLHYALTSYVHSAQDFVIPSIKLDRIRDYRKALYSLTLTPHPIFEASLLRSTLSYRANINIYYFQACWKALSIDLPKSRLQHSKIKYKKAIENLEEGALKTLHQLNYSWLKAWWKKKYKSWIEIYDKEFIITDSLEDRIACEESFLITDAFSKRFVVG